MKYLKYIADNGYEIELSAYGFAPPYYIISVDGIGVPQNELTLKEVPLTDGAFVSDMRMPKRNIVISGKIIANSEYSMFTARRDLIMSFNPKSKGRLYYYINIDSDTTKEFYIDCYVEKSIDPVNTKSGVEQSFLISLLCPNPFWKEVTPISEIGNYTDYFTFPFVSDYSSGFSFAQFEVNKTFTNYGDVDTPLKITFSGAAENPYITNVTTGETIKINKTIAVGEKIVITTDNGNKTVKIHNLDGSIVNAFNYVDLTSKFFKFIPGENIIEYGSSNDAILGGVTIEYASAYLGV